MPNMRIGSVTFDPVVSVFFLCPFFVDGYSGFSPDTSASPFRSWSGSFSSSWLTFDGWEAGVGSSEMAETRNLRSASSVMALRLINRLQSKQIRWHIQLPCCLDSFVITVLTVAHARTIVEVCLGEGKVALYLWVNEIQFYKELDLLRIVVS